MSNKRRRAEIKLKRLARAQRLQAAAALPDPRFADACEPGATGLPAGTAPADRALLARYNNTYGPLPEFYVDRPFVCRDCGEAQVWTAKQQKWWYEVAHGPIDSTAVRCLPCRRARRSDRGDGADLLRELCARTRALGASPPDPAARREIDEALSNKWWSVRTVAIGVLGRWGDPHAVARLKAIVDDTRGPRRWGSWAYDARRAAITALGECLPLSESAWAIEFCLSSDDTWALHPLLNRLGVEALDAIVDAEWRRGDPLRLQRLLWPLAQAPAGAQRQRAWRERFRNHPDASVRRIAAYVWPDPPGSR